MPVIDFPCISAREDEERKQRGCPHIEPSYSSKERNLQAFLLLWHIWNTVTFGITESNVAIKVQHKNKYVMHSSTQRAREKGYRGGRGTHYMVTCLLRVFRLHWLFFATPSHVCVDVVSRGESGSGGTIGSRFTNEWKELEVESRAGAGIM